MAAQWELITGLQRSSVHGEPLPIAPLKEYGVLHERASGNAWPNMCRRALAEDGAEESACLRGQRGLALADGGLNATMRD